MAFSKVYRGYIIEDVDGQWYIRNAPTWTNMNGFNPGPHGGWSIATHQVDKLVEYISRGQEKPRQPPQQNHQPVNTHNNYNYEEDYSWDPTRRSPTQMSPVGKLIFTVMILHFIFWMFVGNPP